MSIYELFTPGNTSEAMQIVECAAKTCCNNSSDKPTLHFFSFPNNEIFARIWATNASREDILSKSIFDIKKYVLCAEHFNDKYFKTEQEKKIFQNNMNPIPTIFRNNLKSYTNNETMLNFMDDITVNNPNVGYNTLSDVNMPQNDFSSNVEFGRLTYTDDLYVEFVSNPGVLSLKPEVTDRIIRRGYCRLCAKQLPIANLVPIFNRRGRNCFGDMLEMCLPGKFNENDKYPHEICSSCIFKLEDCCKILKSFIQADKHIKNIFRNKETAARIVNEINNPNSEPHGVEEILNSYDDKSLIMISPDNNNITKTNNRPQLKSLIMTTSNINKKTKSNDRSDLKSLIMTSPDCNKKTKTNDRPNLKLFEDKSLIMISSDLNKQTKTGDQPDLNSFKHKSLLTISPEYNKQTKINDELYFNNSTEILNNLIIHSTADNNSITNPLVNQKTLLFETNLNRIIEEDKHEIKLQCLTCLKLFNNKKQVSDHSLLSHPGKKKNEKVFRTVKVILRKKKNNEIFGNENKDIHITVNSLSVIANKKGNGNLGPFYRKYKCVKCSKLFPNKKRVIQHSIATHPTIGENDIVCKLVKVKKKTDDNNTKPVEEKSASIRYECLLCLSNHRTKDTLIKHTRLHHPNLSDGKFLCRILKPKKYRNHNVTCLRCSESFASIVKYRKHMKKHASFKCEQCEKTFDKIYKLKEHSKTHKMQTIYNCIGCNEHFTSKKDLLTHEEIHKRPEENVSCTQCNKQFTSAFSLRKHQQVHDSSLCNICGKLFSNKLYLERHLFIHSNERPFKCEICNKAFKTLVTLIKHKECHEPDKKYICQACGKQFRTSGTLRQHMAIHSAIKKHVCDICGNGFHRRGNLLTHREIHNYINDERYKCRVCEKELLNVSSYKLHNLKHKNGDKKPFSCKICDKKFGSSPQLKIHFRLHSGERPYPCDYCENAFRSKATLNQHRLIHGNVFPHECNYCNRKFKRLQSLIVHRKTHTGEKPFACPICQRPFAERSDMMKHKKIHERKAKAKKVKESSDQSVNDSDYMIKPKKIHGRKAKAKIFKKSTDEESTNYSEYMIKPKRKAKTKKKVIESSEESINDSDYMNFINDDEPESDILESLLSRSSP